MKKAYIFLILSFLAFPFRADAGINLPYSTSALTCSEFAQTNNYEGATGCDGVNTYGTWQCDSSHGMQITAAANYPGGDGGKGFRFWYGPGNNQNSGGPRFDFSTNPAELWMRWYVRWEAGQNWSGINQKMLYLYQTPNTVQGIFNITGPTSCLFTAQGEGECYYSGTPKPYCPATDWKSGCGSNVLGFTNGVSNGQWNLIEYHFKENTSGGANGIFEAWINNVLVYSKNNITWAGNGINYILIPSNNHTLPNLTRCAYYDQDDFAFSTTGRIGPYGGAVGSPPPLPPLPTPTPPSIQSIN